MSYEIKNNSELSIILAKAIKAEIIRECGFSEDVAHLVVNHYNLEERGLARMVSEIVQTCKQITGEEAN
jgi:hypothetical protein